MNHIDHGSIKMLQKRATPNKCNSQRGWHGMDYHNQMRKCYNKGMYSGIKRVSSSESTTI